MGNHIRYVFNRKTKVKEIHIKRPLNCTEFQSEEKQIFPISTDILHDVILLKNNELTPEQFESPIEVQFDSGYNLEIPNPSSHLFDAQQKLISRLERELTSAHSDMSGLKVCYEKKLNKSRSNTASIKAETALIIFEMRENVKQLESDKTELISELENIKNSDSENDARKRTNAHTELILNLSEQLLSANEKLLDSNTLVDSLRQNNNNNNNNNNNIPQLNSNVIVS